MKSLGNPPACDASAWIPYGDDSDVVDHVGTCVDIAVTSSTSIGQDISTMFAAAEAGAAAGAGVGVAVGAIATSTTFIDIIDEVGFLDVYDYIVGLILNIAANAGITVATGAALGAVGGVIGSVIGALVGAVIALAQILDPGPGCDVIVLDDVGNINQGSLGGFGKATISCTNYVTNIQAAANWLNANPSALVGLTPLNVAHSFQILVANPNWAAANAANLPGYSPNGYADPSVQTLPAAYELVNRAQLVAAVALVTATPSKLPLWRAVIGGPLVEDDPSRWAAVFLPAAPNGTTGGVGFPGTALAGGGRLYTAPQNLFKNNNALTPGTLKPVQTAMPSGIYMLNSMYPALTTSQCEAIFAAATAAYTRAVFMAMNWADSQKTKPTAAQLGSGSQFNLESSDVNTILAAWKYTPGGIQAPTNAETSSSAVPAVLAVTAGAGALGVMLYARHHRIGFAEAARRLSAETWGKTKQVLHLNRRRA